MLWLTGAVQRKAVHPPSGLPVSVVLLVVAFGALLPACLLLPLLLLGLPSRCQGLAAGRLAMEEQ